MRILLLVIEEIRQSQVSLVGPFKKETDNTTCGTGPAES